MSHKYLHEVGNGLYHLDHRLTPEVRAMFASMASRLPAGGILARYRQVVTEVARSLARETSHANFLRSSDSEWHTFVGEAEDRLTVYPLHPRVQGFFDEFVGNYGHSSIQEQVGDPALYVEGVSWLTAWLLFDSPLYRGQEFSTRAIRHKDWPMARECYLPVEEAYVLLQGEEAGRSLADARRGVVPPGLTLGEWSSPNFREQTEKRWATTPHPDLENLHREWLAAYEAEVEWWKGHLADPANREALGIGDKEPFRPALDRARWALPGTAATGLCFTSDLRERARVLLAGKHLGKPEQPVWQDLADAYCKAQPGIAPHALRKMYPPEPGGVPVNPVPGHLAALLQPAHPVDPEDNPEGVAVRVQRSSELSYFGFDRLPAKGQYADPWTNREQRITLDIECSIAVARDWHRHRTLYPWSMFVVLDSDGLLQGARDYEPKSDYARERAPVLWSRSTKVYKTFMEQGDPQRAALALPFGTRVLLSGQGGNRDVRYTLELRAYAHGANFEYRRQALAALNIL